MSVYIGEYAVPIDLEFINASAGSGKTTRLVNKITELLDIYKVSEIVAITFTNASAKEIKNRVLAKFIGSTREDEVLNLQISTMHSFFIKLLRENAVSINLNSDFKIIDESIKNELIELIFKDTYIYFLKDKDYKFIFSLYDYDSLKKVILKLLNKNYEINLKTEKEYFNDEISYMLNYFKAYVDKLKSNISIISEINKLAYQDNFANYLRELSEIFREIPFNDFYQNLNYENAKILFNYILNLEINNRKSPDKYWDEENAIIFKNAIKDIVSILKEIKKESEIFNLEFIKKSATELFKFSKFYKYF